MVFIFPVVVATFNQETVIVKTDCEFDGFTALCVIQQENLVMVA